MFDLDDGAPPTDLPMDTTGEMPTPTNSVINGPALRFRAHEGRSKTNFIVQCLN